MGVDVLDIAQVYHCAPTGNLADYVQEIGRCARDKNMTGVATEEYLSGDLSQLKRLLYGELRQYQLWRSYTSSIDVQAWCATAICWFPGCVRLSV